jgi:aminoglycoside/choline kinase family phosphotransferase
MREAAIAGFLAASGFADARSAVLAQDASARRYLRLTGGPRPAVLMDAPPGGEDVQAFLRLQAHLAQCGLSVPEKLAADPENGLVLLEDFGDALFPAVLTPDNTDMLYDAATDALARLHAAPAPTLPAWDGPAMARAAEATVLDWWWPASFGAPAPDEARRDLRLALAALLAPLRAGPWSLVHRDFFAGNLFWLPDRPPARRVGVIDFQDAARGHPAYDLVSLVEDARRDLPDGLAERQLGRYLAQRPALDPASFRAAFAICAAQRHLRVAAQWVRLHRRDGKPGFLVHGPRTWRLLARALARPEAAPLAAFLDCWVPPARRGNPAEHAA